MTEQETPPVLDVKDLEVRYGKVIAASEVSLQVRRGEVVAVLGPNGAGKTSVLRSIMGLVPAAKGSIAFFDGKRQVRIERIVSRGHCAPTEGWFEADRNEWVALLRGAAQLEFEDGRELRLVPAKRR